MIDVGRAAAPVHPPATGGTWDVIVVGAGPAGSTAARILAARGHRVLLLDKGPFPREKACGDGLIPDALNCLRRGGLYDEVAAEGYHTQILSVFSPAGIQVDIPGEFITLPRERLDNLLLRRALASGSAFQVGKVTRVASLDGDGVVVGLEGAPDFARARVGIVATGADVALTDGSGPGRRRLMAVALRCYVRSAFRIEQLVVSFDRSILPGYAWIFPLGNGLYNVGCGVFYGRARQRAVNLRHTFAAFLRHFPLARELMKVGASLTPLTGARLRCGLESSVAYDGGAVLCAGETIATTFPFTGEGIGKAMETGEHAAQQTHAALSGEGRAALAAYPVLLERRLAPRYTGYRVAQGWLSHARLSDFVAACVRRSPALLAAAAGVVNETTDPRELFSWRRLIPEVLWGRRPQAHG